MHGVTLRTEDCAKIILCSIETSFRHTPFKCRLRKLFVKNSQAITNPGKAEANCVALRVLERMGLGAIAPFDPMAVCKHLKST